MNFSRAFNFFTSAKFVSWKSTFRLQQTLVGMYSAEEEDPTLRQGFNGEIMAGAHRSGEVLRFPIKPDSRFGRLRNESPVGTTLCKDGLRIGRVERLLSALEGMGVVNCGILIENSDLEDLDVEVPIFDGSASEWVEAIKQVGLKVATDECGKTCEKMAAHINESVHIWKNCSFVAAFPSPNVLISYGINFPQVEKMHHMGLIKVGGLENAILCRSDAS